MLWPSMDCLELEACSCSPVPIVIAQLRMATQRYVWFMSFELAIPGLQKCQSKECNPNVVVPHNPDTARSDDMACSGLLYYARFWQCEEWRKEQQVRSSISPSSLCLWQFRDSHDMSSEPELSLSSDKTTVHGWILLGQVLTVAACLFPFPSSSSCDLILTVFKRLPWYLNMKSLDQAWITNLLEAHISHSGWFTTIQRLLVQMTQQSLD